MRLSCFPCKNVKSSAKYFFNNQKQMSISDFPKKIKGQFSSLYDKFS